MARPNGYLGIAVEFAGRVLADAKRWEWPDDYTAQVMVAALSTSRLKFAIYGPCYYCNTWLATSVDHLNPRARGGGDNRGNLVSACWPCNQSKGDRTAAEYFEALARPPKEPWRPPERPSSLTVRTEPPPGAEDFTLAEVAWLLSFSVSRIERFVKEGHLEVQRTAEGRRIPLASVLSLRAAILDGAHATVAP